ncbi:MAG TPA: hypothetical protein VG296_20425, partial [Actinospica sp.]|nr:hypothetical protein [Actinospica sp.]
VWAILKKARIDPAPRRTGPAQPGPARASFPRSQAEATLATDLFTVALLDSTTTRRIHVLGAPAHPTAERTTQMARNALMDLAEHTDRSTFLIRDHGPQFTAAFDAVLHAADIRIVTTGIQAPAMNAIQERRHRTVRTARPHPDMEPHPTAPSPGRIRILLQRAPSPDSTTSESLATTESAASLTNTTPPPDQHG